MDGLPQLAEITKHNAAQALVDGRGIEAAWGERVARALAEAALQRAGAQVLGDGPRWLSAIVELERRGPVAWTGEGAAPKLGTNEQDGTPPGVRPVKQLLLEFCPWRKGPFDVLGVHVDAEWRCERKWARVMQAVSVAGKTVLDVGCGNGYYLFRALGAGAKAALGIDPTWLYVAQFAALRRLTSPLGGAPLDRAPLGGVPLGKAPVTACPAWVLPLRLEDLRSPDLPQADVVFSMGVLYHRKSPIEHLEALRPLVRQGGKLVLETLVVAGDERTVLTPSDRYAAMRNVWMIPSVDAARRWLERCGYTNVQVADVSPTTTDEQRATEFMTSASLCDFLDPNDPELTIEGYPAPRRAIFVAERQ